VEHLFHDEQRRILDQILAVPSEEIYNTLRHVTNYYAPLRRFTADMRTPPLKALAMATEIVLNTELRRQLQADPLDVERIRGLLAECAASKVPLYSADLAYAFKERFDRLSDQFVLGFREMDCLQRFADAADLMRSLPFSINLWKPQNTYYDVMESVLVEMQRCADEGNVQTRAWVDKFLGVGEKLGFAVANQPQ
jgi:hypothetical protein